MTWETIWVKTASGTTLSPIDLIPLIMDTEEYSFKHKFIICTKLKQPLIIGLDFALRYKLAAD